MVSPRARSQSRPRPPSFSPTLQRTLLPAVTSDPQSLPCLPQPQQCQPSLDAAPCAQPCAAPPRATTIATALLQPHGILAAFPDLGRRPLLLYRPNRKPLQRPAMGSPLLCAHQQRPAPSARCLQQIIRSLQHPQAAPNLRSPLDKHPSGRYTTTPATPLHP